MIIIRTIITLAVLLIAPVTLAGDIDGFWKHSEEPGWIEIRLGKGNGTVIRNDKFPERAGREIIKDLEADTSADNLWRGKIYVERLGEYKDGEISLPEPGRIELKVKVGFISRTVEWVRVDAVPAALDN